MQHVHALLLLLAALLACASACNSTERAVDEVPRTLRGRWLLAELEGVDVEALQESGARLPEILIDSEGAISGFGGVNRFGSSLNLDVLGSAQFVLSPLASTMMAGEPELMSRESLFFQALQDARAYRLSEGRLELLDRWGEEEDELGEIVLVLRRPS